MGIRLVPFLMPTSVALTFNEQFHVIGLQERMLPVVASDTQS